MRKNEFLNEGLRNDFDKQKGDTTVDGLTSSSETLLSSVKKRIRRVLHVCLSLNKTVCWFDPQKTKKELGTILTLESKSETLNGYSGLIGCRTTVSPCKNVTSVGLRGRLYDTGPETL